MITQLVFDPSKDQCDMVKKREIKFGILNYLNAMALGSVSKKEIEQYKQSFIEQIRKTFQ